MQNALQLFLKHFPMVLDSALEAVEEPLLRFFLAANGWLKASHRSICALAGAVIRLYFRS